MVLAEHDSLPLALDIPVINKVSQNLHAEMLLRLLGREKGTGGSVAGGLEVLREFLAAGRPAIRRICLLRRFRIVTPESGLAPRHGQVIALRGQPALGRGIHREPTACRGGWNSRIALHKLPPAAILRAKTGSLLHVNVLSGYLTTAHGERLVFSIMSNNHNLNSKQATGILDEIVREAERTRN